MNFYISCEMYMSLSLGSNKNTAGRAANGNFHVYITSNFSSSDHHVFCLAVKFLSLPTLERFW